jgi:hypothetical protein
MRRGLECLVASKSVGGDDVMLATDWKSVVQKAERRTGSSSYVGDAKLDFLNSGSSA